MAHTRDAHRIDGTPCELLQRCNVIAAAIVRNHWKLSGPLYANALKFDDYCFESQIIYEAKRARVSFPFSGRPDTSCGCEFVLFNRTVLTKDPLWRTNSPPVWEIQQITVFSTSPGADSSGPISRKEWLTFGIPAAECPLPVLPEDPVTGSVAVLSGDFVDGFGLRVNFKPEPPVGDDVVPVVVRSFMFESFWQYCVAQELANLCAASLKAAAKFEALCQRNESKLPNAAK